jgi:type I restriction enzyme S subunit
MAQIGLSGLFQFDSSKVNRWDSHQQDLLKEFWVRSGDLLIAMTDVTPEKNLIGQMAIAELDGVALLNQRVGLLRLKSDIAYSDYFCFLSGLPVWKIYCKGVASLGVQANIGTSDIRKAKVPLPSVGEQTAIATILSDMDEDIQVLEQRLSKTRQIKQGMMQELLTGKTRLIKAQEIPSDAH